MGLQLLRVGLPFGGANIRGTIPIIETASVRARDDKGPHSTFAQAGFGKISRGKAALQQTIAGDKAAALWVDSRKRFEPLFQFRNDPGERLTMTD
jgi:hypothetical protein